jgi:hypothetical protein
VLQLDQRFTIHCRRCAALYCSLCAVPGRRRGGLIHQVPSTELLKSSESLVNDDDDGEHERLTTPTSSARGGGGSHGGHRCRAEEEAVSLVPSSPLPSSSRHPLTSSLPPAARPSPAARPRLPVGREPRPRRSRSSTCPTSPTMIQHVGANEHARWPSTSPTTSSTGQSPSPR